MSPSAGPLLPRQITRGEFFALFGGLMLADFVVHFLLFPEFLGVFGIGVGAYVGWLIVGVLDLPPDTFFLLGVFIWLLLVYTLSLVIVTVRQ